MIFNLKQSKLLFIYMALFMSTASCKKETIVALIKPSILSTQLNSATASNWMELVRQLVKLESKNPPQASRIYGYNAIAVYESVVNGIPGK
jgi:hypothetical protein